MHGRAGSVGSTSRRTFLRAGLRPDKISGRTHMSGVAVEESDPNHRITRLEVLDVTANLFHPARVLEARRDRPAYKAAGGFVYAPADTDVRIVHPRGPGADQN